MALTSLVFVDHETLTGGPHYFETAQITTEGKSPIAPRGKLAEGEARQRQSYGIATFDDRGRLLSYEAVKEGRRSWRSVLAYSESVVLQKETHTAPNGSVVQWSYDRDGWLVGSTMMKGPEEGIE